VLLKIWQFFPLKLKENSPLYTIFVPKTKKIQLFLIKKTEKNCCEKKPFYRFIFSVCNFVMIQKWKLFPEETYISKVFTKKKIHKIQWKFTTKETIAMDVYTKHQLGIHISKLKCRSSKQTIITK